MGVALVPEFAFSGLFSDNVCIRRLTDCIKYLSSIYRTTVVAYKKNKYMSKPTKIFLDMLLENVKKEISK